MIKYVPLLVTLAFGLYCGVEAGKWSFENCIYLSLNGSFFPTPYTKGPIRVDLPSNATVVKEKSHCGNETQSLALSWDWLNVNRTLMAQNITVEFSKNQTSKTYAISRIFGTFQMGEWTEGNKTFSYSIYLDSQDQNKKTILSTPLNRSYVCSDPGNITLHTQFMKNTDSKFNRINDTVLSVVHLRFDAFRDPKTPKGKLQNPLNCIENRISDVVPIVVGCVLALLIVFVLVAYLIGRRRPRSGYLSV